MRSIEKRPVGKSLAVKQQENFMAKTMATKAGLCVVNPEREEAAAHKTKNAVDNES